MNSNSKVWILIPVHNRRETTRACLEHLATLGLPQDFLICVVDDGCTDGTTELLAREFPEVHTVPGNGNLYWGGGIALGMEHARAADAEIHLWLNDDCLPAAGSLEKLVQRVRSTRGVCGGVCYDPDEPTKLTYAGTLVSQDTGMLQAAIEPVAAESLNGNLVAIHRDVVMELGRMPADKYPHFGGDIIYSLRAFRKGLPVEIHPLAKAFNRRDDPLRKVMQSGSVVRLWREMSRVASPLYFRTYWNLLRERFGWQAWFRWPAYFLRMLRLSLKILCLPKL
jgi:GT2 family glycosyltransferase